MNENLKTIYVLALSQRDHITIGSSTRHMPVLPVVRKQYLSNVLEHHIYLTRNQEFLGWCVYMLRLKDDSYYTGITNDIHARLEKHRSGRGSKYVRSRLPLSVIYLELVEDQSTARKLEYSIKKLSREEKYQFRTAPRNSTIVLECACGFVIRIPELALIPQPLLCVACNSIIDT